jgi:Binding-protein-dependent transport system inner membrane component
MAQTGITLRCICSTAAACMPPTLSHIAPNVVGLVLTVTTLDMAGVVVSEATLSLLGLDVQPPHSSIGLMINSAISVLNLNWTESFFPGLVLTVMVLCFSFVGDGLRDALDPRTLRSGCLCIRYVRHALHVPALYGRGATGFVRTTDVQRVFVFHGGNVSVLDAASGRLLRTVAIGPPVVGGFPNLVISQRLGRVFVSTAGSPGVRRTTGREGYGSLHMLHGRSGTIVRTWPVGWLPGPRAVDERHRDAGRVAGWPPGSREGQYGR